MEQSMNEITVSEVLAEVKILIRFLLRKWILLVSLGLIGGVYGYYTAMKVKPTYTADLSFFVEDAKSGGSSIGSYAGIASEFGVDLGGGGSGGLYQTNNLQEFFKSRLLIQKVMLQPYPKDSSKSLADVYFFMTGMKQKWDQSYRTKNVQFHPMNNNFSLMQDSAFKILQATLVNEIDLKILPIKKSNILKISYTSQDQYFACVFVNKLVDEAIDFYIKTKTSRSQIQVDNLQRKSDSLQMILNRKYYNTASSKVFNINPAEKTALVANELGTFDRTLTQTMYADVYKNLEIAKSSLAQDMPNIQIIDKPTLPLTIQKKSKLISTLIFGIGLGFLGIILLVLNKYLNSFTKIKLGK